ncbi:MAG: hypothetical protein HY794_18260 [Desulfarculus sp.]|nr:hypothetical protein [Desulfarculus sp.]
MKIVMMTSAAGPEGVLHAGREYNLPGKQAKALVAGGFAREVGQAPRLPLEPPPALEAAAQTQPETTALPAAGPRA